MAKKIPTDILDAIQTLDASIKILTSTLKQHKTSTTSFGGHASSGGDTVKDIEERIELYKTEREELRQSIEKQQEYAKELGITTTSLKKVVREVAKVNTLVENITVGISSSVSDLQKQIKEIPVKKFSKVLDSIIDGYNNFNARLSIPTNRIIRKALNFGDEIERITNKLSNLNINVTGTATVDVDTFNASIGNITTAFGVLYNAISNASSNLSNLNINVTGTATVDTSNFSSIISIVVNSLSIFNSIISNTSVELKNFQTKLNTFKLSSMTGAGGVLDVNLVGIDRTTSDSISDKIADRIAKALSRIVMHTSLYELSTPVFDDLKLIVGSSGGGSGGGSSTTSMSNPMGDLRKMIAELIGVAITHNDTYMRNFNKVTSSIEKRKNDSVSRVSTAETKKLIKTGSVSKDSVDFSEINANMGVDLFFDELVNSMGDTKKFTQKLADIATAHGRVQANADEMITGSEFVKKLLNDIQSTQRLIAGFTATNTTESLAQAKIQQDNLSKMKEKLPLVVAEALTHSRIEHQLRKQLKVQRDISEHRKKSKELSDKELKIANYMTASLSKLQGVSAITSFVSEIRDTFSEVNEDTGKSFIKWGDAVKSTLKRFGVSTSVFIVQQGIQLFNQLEASAASFRRETGLTRSNTLQIDRDVSSIVTSYTHLGTNAESVYKSVSAFKNEFGDVLDISRDVLAATTILNTNFGVAADDSAKVMRIFQSMGGYSQEAAANIQLQVVSMAKAARVAPSKVMKDIAESAETASVYFKGNVNALAQAAVNARRLGTTLKDVTSTADKLLDFESSITAELEATAFLGGRFDLTRARALAAAGDTIGMQEEILSQVRAIGDFNEKDLWTQRAIANATGLSVEELRRQLMLQDQMSSLSDEDRRRAEQAVAQGIDLSNLSHEQLKDRLHQLSVEQEMQSNVERIKNSFAQLGVSLGSTILPLVELISHLLMPIAGLFNSIATSINSLPPAGAAFIKTLISWGAIAGITYAIMKKLAITSLLAAGPPGWAILAVAGLMAVGSAWSNFSKNNRYSGLESTPPTPTVGDAIIPSKGPMQLSTREGGLIEFSPNDDIIAAPNLADNINRINNNKNTQSPQTQDLSPIANSISQSMQLVVNEIKGLRNDMISGKIAVYMDGRRVTAQINRINDRVTQNSYGVSM